ncbi:relaxase/mobilization nuclease domain-containing protein [Serratia nevei]|uniref:relaxase/mobilization nuclease domain-containing protein n=1 Tax=Serratia nevei TaxID=2703794 RepID=UPI003F820EA9
MLIKVFADKKGRTSATGAVNYVLSDKDYTGKLRDEKPKILRGSVEVTKQLDELTKNYSSQSAHGVISFRPGETLTDKQKEKLLDDFEKTFLGNMRNRVNCLFVEHTDKDNRLEIHFVINKVDLGATKKKSYNPFPPGYIQLKEAFVSLKNDEFDFDQITFDRPLKNSFSSEEVKALKIGNHRFKTLDKKADIDKHLQKLVKDGKIKNRKQLISYLENNGYKLSRKDNPNYLSIEVDGGRNIRLKDGIYKDTGKNYDVVVSLNKEKAFDRQACLNILNKELEKRNLENTKRYGAKPQKLVSISSKTPQEPKSKAPDGSTPSQESIVATGATTTHQAQPTKTQDQQGSSSSSGSGFTAVERAKAKLANAKTTRERIEAEYELAIALAELQAQELSKQNNNRKIKI